MDYIILYHITMIIILILLMMYKDHQNTIYLSRLANLENPSALKLIRLKGLFPILAIAKTSLQPHQARNLGVGGRSGVLRPLRSCISHFGWGHRSKQRRNTVGLRQCIILSFLLQIPAPLSQYHPVAPLNFRVSYHKKHIVPHIFCLFVLRIIFLC